MYEEQRLSHISASPEYNAALPRRPPSSPAHSQGLQLSTNDDVLLGRADDGLILRLCSMKLHESPGLHFPTIAVGLVQPPVSEPNTVLLTQHDPRYWLGSVDGVRVLCFSIAMLCCRVSSLSQGVIKQQVSMHEC